MKILAISGSVRLDSFNTALLNSMSKLAPENVHITLSDSIKDIPIFQPEVEDKSLPALVNTIISQIKAADGLIISTPEYAHGISGVLKNTLDWLVATDAMVLKPVVITSVSTSGLGGVKSFYALLQTLYAMNSNIIIDASLCVPSAKNRFNADLELTDEITIKAIGVSLLALERAIDHIKA